MDNAIYDRFIGDNNALVRCPGYCAGSEDGDETTCQGTWHEAYCRLADGTIRHDMSESQCKSESSSSSSDSSASSASIQENYWVRGYCELTQEQCHDSDVNWVNYEIEDMGEGQFIRKKGNKYYCGLYNAIMSETAGECDSKTIARYREDFSLNLCMKNLKCQSAYYQGERKVAICNRCDDAQILCPSVDGTVQCVALASDPHNCGECGKTCDEGEFCDNGSCKKEVTTTCPQEQIRCFCLEIDGKRECHAADSNEQNLKDNEYCLDPLDSATCGIMSCEDLADEKIIEAQKCTAGQRCGLDQDGNYECKCADGTFKYKGKCVSPTSPESCGISQDNPNDTLKCDTTKSACNGTTCVCVSPYYLCVQSGLGNGSDCFDVLNDSQNCGGCHVACSADKICVNGQCQCPENEILCDGQCIDPMTDKDHCGARGNCTNDNPTENENAEGDFENAEEQDTNDNPLNSAGVQCKDADSCANGKCDCGKDEFRIGGECISASDARYCGATADEEGKRGQDCTVIPYAQCSIVYDRYRCSCANDDGKGNAFIPVYDGTILKKCVNPEVDDEYCGYPVGGGVYEDCTAKKEGQKIWSCQNGICVEGCRSDSIKCVQKCVGEDEGEEGMCAYCLSTDVVEYRDENSNSCICRKCGDDDNPATGCSDFSRGESLEHCTACHEPCAPHFKVCKKVTSQMNPFVCACSEGETEVAFSETEKACLIPSETHVEQGTSGFWQCQAPWINVDNDWSNGCEVDSSSDTKYCGDNRVDCTILSNVGMVVCQEGQCKIQSCQSGYNDCNQNVGDGCEAYVKSDTSNCNLCHVTCGRTCQDGETCASQCVEGMCCQTGEFDRQYGAETLYCCDHTKLYRYNKSGWWIFSIKCPKNDHYGCFEQNPDGKCWTEVR